MRLTVDRRHSRHPFEIFMLALCAFTGIPFVLGEPTAGSIEALLPVWAENLWGACLSLGAILALVGVALRRRDVGLLAEQVGLVCVSVATGFYAAVLAIYVGSTALTPGVIVLGFGLSCGWRAVQIQKQINDVISWARSVEGE